VDDVVAHVVVGAEVRDLSSVLFLERREGVGIRVRGGEGSCSEREETWMT
jgi:hypothetical protein